MNQNMTYCETCKKDVPYLIKEELKKETSKTVIYEYKGKTAYCPYCGNKVSVKEINEYNASSLDAEIRRVNHLISYDKILELPKRYAIGKRPLSLLLGWGELTFNRYYDGDLPSKHFSETLEAIYDHPEYYLEILEANKDRLPSELAYTRSKAATKDLLADLGYLTSKLELAAEYIAYHCGDISPSALQKALYFAQGFFYAFYGSYLFQEECEIGPNGPVFPDLPKHLANYHFNPLRPRRALSDFFFTKAELTILDMVIKSFCCYSDMILKSFIEAETLWLDLVKDLPANTSAHFSIEQEKLGAYFVSVKETHHMTSALDIRKYARSLFEQL